MIIPSILHDSIEEVQQSIRRFSLLSPRPHTVQIDIVDGEFAEELTIEARAIRELDFCGMAVDVDLMTLEPAGHVREVANVPGVRWVIGLVDRMSSMEEFVDEVEAAGLGAGLSLDLYTPFSAIPEALLPRLKAVQVMCGPAGKQGQEFSFSAMPVLQEAMKTKLAGLHTYKVFADIGLRPDTIPFAQRAGAQGFVVGSYLNGDNAQERWLQLLEAEQ